MKIKRYFARDMRSALRAVQQEQGPDAVILSSHEVDGGIELVAAVDYDESLIHQARRPRQGKEEGRIETSGFDAADVPAQAFVPTPSRGSDVRHLEAQMEAMRELIESRLDSAPASYQSPSAGRRNAHALLSGLGLRSAQAGRLAEAVDARLDPAQARQQVLALMAQQLPVGRLDLLSQGGALALIGPTGVGKTTTAAKLAARHILKFGQGSVQLVGTDEYRIGAQEQLAAYARILGAPLHRVGGATELADILAGRQSEELILIDTAGVGGRDLALHQQFELLLPQSRLHRALCLSAATGVHDLAMQARRFAAARPNCLILTKLDETLRLGEALGFLMEQRLPLAYTSDGQQVPEDLHLPRAADLVSSALEQRRQSVKIMEAHRACA